MSNEKSTVMFFGADCESSCTKINRNQAKNLSAAQCSVTHMSVLVFLIRFYSCKAANAPVTYHTYTLLYISELRCEEVHACYYIV